MNRPRLSAHCSAEATSASVCGSRRSAATSQGLRGGAGDRGEVAADNGRGLWVVGHAEVVQDAADDLGEQFALRLGEPDAALLDADVDACLGDAGEVAALLLVEADPHVRLVTGALTVADRAVRVGLV